MTEAQALQQWSDMGHKFLSSPPMLAWASTVLRTLGNKNTLVFRQLFEKESSTYTYLLADAVTKEAVLIDPVFETAERDEGVVRGLGLTLKYVINTHVHADHITGSGLLKAKFPGCQSALAAAAGAAADVQLLPQQTLVFGTRSLVTLPTPGHTAGCCSFLMDDMSMVFTGDALLVRGCGRTDFQGGSAETLYSSVHSQLLSLPPSTKVQPAHDYSGRTCSTVGEERALNPRLTKTLAQFVDIMQGLNLSRPKKIDEAVPANLNCGLF
ncbi:ETHE1, mitochondrial-like protein [Ochromonadaceae sp. CCMP2298]|nr:ETHE1, mitochondrial-like protein [Ochromonadaceae sp. CCMP2298]